MDKHALRTEMRRRRQSLTDRAARSRAIWEHVFALAEYASSTTVMCYVHLRGEVETRDYFERLWRDGRRVVVPYCRERSLGLFAFESLDELIPGTLGILEPPSALCNRPERRVMPRELDLILAPGVAFDRGGGRLGQGGGYYDRLLADIPASTAVVGLAFECQMVDQVPLAVHDRHVHKVVTEEAVYGCTRNAMS